MVKENGMVMMSEAEYAEMKNKIWKLDNELDVAKMELATYRQGMKKLAKQKLNSKSEKVKGIEIPAGDFADLIDNMTCDWLGKEGREQLLEKLEETDLWFMWNGFCARIPYGCEICNEVLPAIKEAYEEYNS